MSETGRDNGRTCLLIVLGQNQDIDTMQMLGTHTHTGAREKDTIQGGSDKSANWGARLQVPVKKIPWKGSGGLD